MQKPINRTPNKPYIVAEIGLNWNGDMDLCRKTIEAAHDAGADAVKFQNYKTESFIGQRSEFWEYENNGQIVKESQYDMFKRHELTFEQLVEINEICEANYIDWHSTPMCVEGLTDLIALDVPIFKNGSDCLQDLGLIAEMAKWGREVVISTGMAKISEIAAAVETYRANTAEDKLTLLHCTSAYPAPAHTINIRRIKTLRDTFGCPVGFSDHSQGITAAVLAVSQGATWIEKHFTLDRSLPGPDHAMSADPEEMRALVFAVYTACHQMGDPVLGITNIEKENRRKWFK